MTTFTVSWEEDIEADSPVEAVAKARILLATNPGLVFFTVTNERGDEMEVDVATGKIRYTRQIPEHKHDFVGDEDTCVVYRDCPVTWAAFRATRSEHVHRYKTSATWPEGPDGEIGKLKVCDCGDAITESEGT